MTGHPVSLLKIIIIMSIIIITIIPKTEGFQAHKCCKENNNFYQNGRCIDGTNFQIKCKLQFKLDPNSTEFTPVIDSGGRLVIDQDPPIPPDLYCLSARYVDKKDYYIICAEEGPIIETASNTLNTILSFISVFFIILTLIVYLTVEEMQDMQGIIIMHSITGLGLGFICLGIANLLAIIDDATCHLMAYLIYFTMLYAFFWLNALSFHIWRQVIKPQLLKNIVRWKLIYHLYGIGSPTICLLFLITINHVKLPSLQTIHPGIGEGRCWFKTQRETFIFFYGPVAVLIVVNIIYFLWAAIVLRTKYIITIDNKTKFLNYRFRLYCKLFIIMGITWIFEVISAAFANNKGIMRWLWIPTDALNALEGLIIFLILVVFRKKVKRALANKTIFNKFQLPAKWKTEHDSECDPIEEEINLSGNFSQNM